MSPSLPVAIALGSKMGEPDTLARSLSSSTLISISLKRPEFGCSGAQLNFTVSFLPTGTTTDKFLVLAGAARTLPSFTGILSTPFFSVRFFSTCFFIFFSAGGESALSLSSFESSAEGEMMSWSAKSDEKFYLASSNARGPALDLSIDCEGL